MTKIATKERCQWAKPNSELYLKYHDTEWGVPVFDDQIIFQFLLLESFQAGLSWITILKKRENFKQAFDQFNYYKIAQYKESKIQKLMQNTGIVRNQLKIRATVNNAQQFIKIQKEFGSFSQYMWQFVNHQPIINQWKTTDQIPTTTKESDALSKDLKKRGFKFMGSTVVYAHMQACGMVNDHTINCFRYHQVSN